MVRHPSIDRWALLESVFRCGRGGKGPLLYWMDVGLALSSCCNTAVVGVRKYLA